MSEISKLIPEWVFNIIILITVPSVAIYFVRNWRKFR